MALTRDGLVRALRGRVHTLADEVEAGYRRGRKERGLGQERRVVRPRKAIGETSDDIARR